MDFCNENKYLLKQTTCANLSLLSSQKSVKSGVFVTVRVGEPPGLKNLKNLPKDGDFVKKAATDTYISEERLVPVVCFEIFLRSPSLSSKFGWIFTN